MSRPVDAIDAAVPGRPLGPLALVELLDRDGTVRQAWPVWAWPVTLGRAIDNDIVIDDPALAGHHLRLEGERGPDLQDGAVPRLHVLPSLNAAQLGRRRLAPGSQVPWAGEVLRAGHSMLRLRHRGEVLAPEQPLARGSAPKATLLLFLVLMLWAGGVQWLALDPDAKWTDWVPGLLAWPAALAVWAGGWALLSRLFQRRSDFGVHLGIAVRYLLAINVAEEGLPAVAGMLGVPVLSHVAPAVGIGLAALGVLAHTRQVWPRPARWLALAAVSGLAVMAVLTLALNQQRTDRWFTALYLTALPPPALNAARSVDVDTFLQAAEGLKDRVDARVRQTADDLAAEPEGSEPMPE